MTPEQAEGFRLQHPRSNPKFGRRTYIPLQEIGKLVLNKNPENYFAEIEQVFNFSAI